MAKAKTLRELQEIARTDPGSLTLSQLSFLRTIAKQQQQKQKAASEDEYADHKDRAAKRQKSLAFTGRDCHDWLTAVDDPERKAACAKSLERFCNTYHPLTFALPWCQDHLRVIAKLEQAVLRGGRFAMAMPRGHGKSVLVKAACEWAALYGHHEFICLIGSTDGAAREMLDGIKSDLENNMELYADFPEVCGPIRALEGIANRCPGQHSRGKRTHIGWRGDEIVLPTVEDSPASGVIIRVAGITGRLRGMSFSRPDGQTVRPSLVILDDPQTDESARSLSQCQKRERIISGAVLGLAGPKRKISAVMPCTVIVPGDVADNLLDQEINPDWNGERTKLMPVLPTNKKMWDRYADIRAENLRRTGTIEDATQFYRENREAMDLGAVVSWQERYEPDEISAIQHAMNLLLKDKQTFWAEYQNEPLPDKVMDDEQLSADDFCNRVNGIPQRIVPLGHSVMTAYIDMQLAALPFVVCSWGAEFTGSVVDYGVWPAQGNLNEWMLRTTRPTIRDYYQQHEGKDAGTEGLLHYALTQLVGMLLAHEWECQDGTKRKIERIMIDAQWQESTDVVYQFCRDHEFTAMLLPSHGFGITATNVPFSERKVRPGERVGLEWRMPVPGSRRGIRHVNYDTNHWKTFVQNRMMVAIGDPGALTLFGRKPAMHARFAEHFRAEYPVVTRNENTGRTVVVWKSKPFIDNHWWDGLVGCAVGASIQGCALPSQQPSPSMQPRQRIKLSELQAQKRQAARKGPNLLDRPGMKRT